MPLGLQDVKSPIVSRQQGHESDRTHRPHLPHEIFLVLTSVRG